VSDIFISYASENREQAHKLACALETLGWSVWWDRHIITGHPLAGRSRGKDLSYRKNFVLSLFFFSPSS
jgi:hypothetical protein